MSYMNDFGWLLVVLSGLLMSFGMISFIPTTSSPVSINNIRRYLGFEEAQQKAQSIGMALHFRHYLILSIVSLGLGCGLAYWMGNIYFLGTAIVMAFFIPRSIIEDIKYRKRKDILFNVVPNLRQLISQFADSKSLLLALERSIPAMMGSTKPAFEELYEMLRVGIKLETALIPIKNKISFNKFDDFCDKLISAEVDGYHEQSINSMKSVVKNLSQDIQYLKEIAISNRNKILAIYSFFALAWMMPYLCAYMELQMVKQIHGSLSIHAVSGEILITLMGIVTVLAMFYYKNLWMRINFDQL
jgi:hypothetical protein